MADGAGNGDGMAVDGAEVVARRPLYGGALEVTLPTRLADVSPFRQIPDNQEVFADASTDQSVVIELLEPPEEAPDATAARFHFNTLAADNEASQAVVQQEPLAVELPNGVRTVCWGVQQVAKYKDGAAAANSVMVYVACFRLKDAQTDVVLSFNSPVWVNAESSSAEVVEGDKVAHTNTAEHALGLFKAMVASLAVLDYSLFVN